MTQDKDLNAMLRQAERQGAVIEFSGSGHRKVTFNGRSTTVAVSPSNRYAFKRARTDLRKLGLDL